MTITCHHYRQRTNMAEPAFRASVPPARKPATGVRWVALALAALCIPFPAAGAERVSSTALGTLLFSPAERTALTLARGGNAARDESGSAVLTVSGLVHRGRGKSTVWLNQQPYPEGQAVPSAGTPRIAATGIALGGRQARVGETIDLSSNARSDLVPEGALQVRK